MYIYYISGKTSWQTCLVVLNDAQVGLLQNLSGGAVLSWLSCLKHLWLSTGLLCSQISLHISHFQKIPCVLLECVTSIHCRLEHALDCLHIWLWTSNRSTSFLCHLASRSNANQLFFTNVCPNGATAICQIGNIFVKNYKTNFLKIRIDKGELLLGLL